MKKRIRMFSPPVSPTSPPWPGDRAEPIALPLMKLATADAPAPGAVLREW